VSETTVISWGTQTRARCPHCKIIMGVGSRVDCKRCGRSYRLIKGAYKETRAK